MDILNKEIVEIKGLEQGSSEVLIVFTDGSVLEQIHHQDCCECVEVEQVDGDIGRHIGAKCIGIDTRVVELGDEGFKGNSDYYESATATFYTLTTSKGYLDWRWVGESNGYYSEDVSMVLR